MRCYFTPSGMANIRKTDSIKFGKDVEWISYFYGECLKWINIFAVLYLLQKYN